MRKLPFIGSFSRKELNKSLNLTKINHPLSNKIRKETNCLNCGSEVLDRFCSHCGQENTVHPESFISMVRHYFDDLTHFDSKLFTSIWYLFSKPGHLTNVFNAGQRKKYIHPIRMYIFVSVLTFSYLFFTTHKLQDIKLGIDDSNTTNTNVDSPSSSESILKFKVADTRITKNNWRQSLDSAIVDSKTEKTDNWLTKTTQSIIVKSIKSFRKNPDAFVSKLVQNFLHNLPKTLLICLPFFALFLFFLFYRKDRYFVEHAIFSIHYHILLLLIVLLMMVLSQLNTPWILIVLLGLSVIFFLYKSLRNVYLNKRITSIIKCIVLLTLYFFIIMLVQVLNLIFSLSSSNI